jgi:hypothetical protein
MPIDCTSRHVSGIRYVIKRCIADTPCRKLYNRRFNQVLARFEGISFRFSRHGSNA